MEEWGYPRRKSWKLKAKFTDLKTYLEHSEKTGKQTDAILKKLIKPFMKQCAFCGTKEKLHIKCFRKPVTSVNDFTILCSACLFAPYRKGIDGIELEEIRRRYSAGEKVTVLAKEYGITRGRIYHIIWKGAKND